MDVEIILLLALLVVWLVCITTACYRVHKPYNPSEKNKSTLNTYHYIQLKPSRKLILPKKK